MIAKEQTSDNLQAALAWYDAGCSVIPIRADGSKIPALKWDRYQQVRATREQVEKWFTGRNYGIGIVTGAVSGNLEMAEIEGRATDGESFDKLSAAADVDFDNWAQWTGGHRTYAEITPSGGLHLLYRVEGGNVPGNTKLAANADNECLSETRGEGGYVVVAPSGGKVHDTGESWRAINGCLPAGIEKITRETRDKLIGVLKVLDQRPERAPQAPRSEPARVTNPGDESPADHFNRVTAWAEILEPHGWQFHHNEGREEFWTRPGKERRLGHSASTGFSDTGDRMFNWSSSGGLPIGEPMSKFFVWAELNHRGDMKTAAAELRRQGFGTDRPMSDIGVDVDDWKWIRELLGQPQRPEKPVAATESKKPNRLDVISADHFKVKRVRWLWENRVPIGELTLVPGREGVGKSLFLAKIAADITHGTLEGEFFGQPRPIIYVANEDSWNHTLSPRMIAAGADMSKVLKLIISKDAEERSSFSLPRDTADLTDLVLRTGAGAVMFDPVLSCLDDTIDVNKAQSLRSALEPLRRSAEDSGAAYLALMHFNKSTGGDMSTKIAGSRAFTEVARAIIGLAKLPKKKSDDEVDEFLAGPAECVISQGKNNLGRLDLPNLKYHIENVMLPADDDDGEASVGRLVLEGESEISAEEALNGTAEPTGGQSDLTRKIISFVEADYAKTRMASVTQQVVQAFGDVAPETVRKALSRAKSRGLLNSPRYGAWEPVSPSRTG